MSKRKPAGFGRPENLHLSAEDYFNPSDYQEKAAQEFINPPLQSQVGVTLNRRDFLKWAGLATAAFSVGCIRRPVQKIVPYTKQPEVITFGKDLFYTSTWFDGLEGLPILVRTREGRPLRFEGLPFELSRGGLPARAHGDLWQLYDPERLQANRFHLFNKDRTKFDVLKAPWDEVDSKIAESLKKGQVAVVTGPLGSLSERRVVADFCQAFNARHFVWHPGHYSLMAQAFEKSYGLSRLPFFRFDQADVVVTFGADFLGGWLSPTVYAYQWSQRRQRGQPPRLIAFESVLSLTGSQADQRFPVKPTEVLPIALGLLHDLVMLHGLGSPVFRQNWGGLLKNYAGVATKVGISQAVWDQLVTVLKKSAPRAVVVADHRAVPGQHAFALYQVMWALNQVLGAPGNTISDNLSYQVQMPVEDGLDELARLIESQKVDVLIIRGVNLAWGHPDQERWKQLLKQVPLVVQVTSHLNETSQLAHYVLAESHPQEQWNDLLVWDGFYHIHQPTIRPLYDTREFGFILMSLAYEAGVGPKRLQELESYYDYVRDTFSSEVLPLLKGGNLEEVWNQALEDGYVKLKNPLQVTWNLRFRLADSGEWLKDISSVALGRVSKGWQLCVYEKSQIRWGQWGHIPWIQELPDPVSKVTWGNYAAINPVWAKSQGIQQGQILEIQNGAGVSIRLPAYLMPGIPSEVVAVSVGYGRQWGPSVAVGVGQDVTLLSHKSFSGLSGMEVSVKVTPEVKPLACVQDHHAMEGRMIAVTRQWSETKEHEISHVHGGHEVFSLWPGHAYNGHKWAMVVDLDACIGCGACMVACQAENNIPTVGPENVREGREMHWIRVDRYFEGPIDNPQVVFQPVMCQQCDNAPCETVCPVIATAHNDEGLNDMAYNRCVGTRYCANNCPYKVRRFNWFNYTKDIPKPLHMALNPDVTVRHRGVMEKCTFCVHRIKAAKLEAKVQSKSLKDGDILTACQQTCPTGAIIFGDLNDPESQVARLFKDARAYELLQEWNVGSNVRYLVRWRRPLVEEETRPEGAHESHS